MSYLEGPQSDHRGIFVGIDQQALLGHLPSSNPLQSATSRILKSGNPELVELYQTVMHKYYKDHDMISRIADLQDNAASMSKSDFRHALEKWDADQGRAMKYAETSLTKPPKPYKWSPTLRDAGITYLYWRLRLRELQQLENYQSTFDRMEQLIQQHDNTYHLPHRTTNLSIPEVKHHLNLAKTELKKHQLYSVDLRFRSYLDLLAGYAGNTDPATIEDSKRKTKIVRNTIRSERNRAMHRNIRQVVTPIIQGSLNKILAPWHRDSQEFPTDFQSFLAQTDADNIIWDAQLDKESIERSLLTYNRNSFRAAAISPWGKGTMHNLLTFSNLSLEAAELLSGTIPADWHGDDETLREFLTSFAIPDSV